MSSISDCHFYCLTFNNNEKKKNMLNRFVKLDIPIEFHTGVNLNDYRLRYACNKFCKRQWSITYGHLDIIHNFYVNSDKKYAIICEDDIFIHKNIKDILPKIINDFNNLGLDILLLGYMLPYSINPNDNNIVYKLKKINNKKSELNYHFYPDYLSGTLMYMITKDYAKHLLDNYYINYAGFGSKSFISDKIIIKDGNRALLYPMIALENDEQHDNYHKLCQKVNYNENYI